MRDSHGIPATLLVLGGTSEIARATTDALVARGTRHVVLAGRNPDLLEEAARSLRDDSRVRSVATAQFDALEFEHHADFARTAFAGDRDIDAVLVACGEYASQDSLGTGPEAARELMATNLTGLVSVSVPIVEALRAQGHGVLIVLSSVGGQRPRRSEYTYDAAKAGLDTYFQGLADALVGSGVSVLLVRPGSVLTRMTRSTPRRPWAISPQTVAEAIARGLERDAEVIWVPSALRWVMAGVRLMPRPVFRALTAAMERRGLA